MFKDEFEKFYIVGQKYSKFGKVYILKRIISFTHCDSCPGPFGDCDGTQLQFLPETDWECPYDGDELAYEKVHDTNERW